MEKTHLILAVLFLIFIVLPICSLPSTKAQSPETDVNLSIIYPPRSPNRYENSSFTLAVQLRLLEGSPRPTNFSFSLDGNQPISFEDISTSKLTYWDPHVYTLYKARYSLENVPEGNHTITAYADGMVASTTFRVNSFYHPAVVKIISPTNQTYSSSVPLVFNVNMPIEGAFYYMYRGYDDVFENNFNGNITMEGLSIGNYVLHLYVTTENGVDSSSTSFSVINKDKIDLTETNFALIIVLLVLILFSVMLVYQLKKRMQSRN